MVDVGPNEAGAPEVSKWKIRARRVLKIPERVRRPRSGRADGGPPPLEPRPAAPEAPQAADQNARKIRELVAKWEGIAAKLKTVPLERRRDLLRNAQVAANADLKRLATEPGMVLADVDGAKRQIFAFLSGTNIPGEAVWTNQIEAVKKGETRELRERAHAQLAAKMMQVRNRIALDQGLTDAERRQEVERLDRLMEQSRAARDPAPELQKFPSEETWMKVVAQLEKMPPEAREKAAERVVDKIKAMRAQIMNARTEATHYADELSLLARIEDRIRNTANPDPRFVAPEAEDRRVVAAIRNIEGYIRDIGDNPVLTDAHRQRFENVKQHALAGDDPQLLDRLALMSIEMRGLAKQALIDRQNARKAAENAAIHNVMGKNAELLEKSTFVAGSADLILQRKKDLDIGKRFRVVLDGMRDCENLDDPAKLDQMIQKAQDYISRYENDLSDRDKAKPAMKEKCDIARQAMAQAKLRKIAIAYNALGAPDQWDATTSGKAAELQAKFFFEEGRAMDKEGNSGFGAIPLKAPASEEAAADPNEPKNMNEAWWVKRRAVLHKVSPVDGADTVGVTEGKDESLFIFKPKELEGTAVKGLDAGTGAAREVFANDLSNLLMAEGGLDIGVCKTTLARIDGDMIQGNDKLLNAPGSDRLGSMQQLAASGKFLETLKNEDPNFAVRVDKENFDQIVLFDMIIGNFDRHSRNALIEDPGDGGPVKMVPIDHGTSMASAETVEANAHRLVGGQNAMLSSGFPQAEEPLSPEVLRKLQMVDPAAISQGLREASANLLAAHADSGLKPNEVLDEEQIIRMEKTIRFIQSAGEIGSVRALFKAVANHSVEIANTPNDQIAAKAAEIMPDIQRAMDETALLTPYFEIEGKDLETLAGYPDLKNLHNWMLANGWFPGTAPVDIGDLMMSDPRKIAQILARGEPNSAAINAREQALEEVGGPDAVDLSNVAKIEDQFKLLTAKRSERFREQCGDLAENDFQNQIAQLGGLALHDAICNILPREKRLAERAGSPEEKNAEIYRSLKEFDLLARHMGLQQNEILERLQQRSQNDALVGFYVDIFRTEDAEEQIDDMDEQAMQAAIRTSCENLMAEYERLEASMHKPENRQATRAVLDEARTLFQQGLVTEAQKLLLISQSGTLMKKQNEISLARNAHRAGRDLVETLLAQIDPASPQAAVWRQELDELANSLDQALAEGNLDNMLSAKQREDLQTRFDDVFAAD